MGSSKQANGNTPEAKGLSLIQTYKDDSKRLRKDGPPSRDTLVLAVGYWICFPSFLEDIACVNWPKGIKVAALQSLYSTHAAATDALMHEAERNGLDPAAFYVCGRVVQEIYREDPDRVYRRGNYDTWPECMGAWQYKLPEPQQEALRTGEAAFIRLCVKLDVVDEKTVVPKQRGRKPATQSNHDLDSTLVAEWKRAQESNTPKRIFCADHGMTVADLDRIINRARKRKIRGNHSDK